MAGIVLTVGMAVDANIIINERIREALRGGFGIAKSIEMGLQTLQGRFLIQILPHLLQRFCSMLLAVVRLRALLSQWELELLRLF